MQKLVGVLVGMAVAVGISLVPGGVAAVDRCPKSGHDLNGDCQNWCYANAGMVGEANMAGCLLGCARYKLTLARDDGFQCEGKVIYHQTAPVTLPGDPPLCGISGYALTDPHCKDRCRWRDNVENGSCIIGCMRYEAKIGEAGCWNKIFHEW